MVDTFRLRTTSNASGTYNDGWGGALLAILATLNIVGIIALVVVALR
jgi:hypothetical protein